MDGQALHSLLTELGCPAISSFTPSGLDWLFESKANKPFLQWFLTNISRDNVLSDEDLEAYSALPEDKLLSGPLLTAALGTCGLSEDTHMSEAELEDQIAELERELGEQESARDGLERLREASGAGLVREVGLAGQVVHMQEAAQREERRRQEQILSLSNTWDSAVSHLEKALTECAQRYREAGSTGGSGSTGCGDTHPLLASLSLDKLRVAEEGLETELNHLIARQFGEEQLGGGVMKPRVLDLGVSNFEENLKGGDRSEFSTLCSEIQRLQSSFYKAELERTLLRAREEGLKAVLDYRSKGGGGVGEITHSTGEVEKLQRELELVLGELSREHCKNILIQDYKAKAKRGEVTLARLEGLRDVLLYQAARGELLRLLAEKESKEVSDLIVSLEEITQDFTAQAQAVTNFKTAVSSLKMDDDKDGLVPSDDLIMLRLHRLLGLGKTDLTSHLPTYSAIRAGLDNLTLEEARVTKELCDARQGREVQFQHLDRDTRHLTRQLGLQEGRQVSLGPRTVRDGVTSLETGIRELERNLKKLMDAWEKEKQELKNKPHLKLQRDAWLDFIVRPKVLAANIKSLENKVKN